MRALAGADVARRRTTANGGEPRLPEVLVLALIGGVAVLAAQAPDQAAPAFEVASVKPAAMRTISLAPIPRAQPGGRFRADMATVADLLWFAYGARQDLIVGGPEWVRQDRFEINAKASTDAPAAEIRLMVRSLLEDRFKLVMHNERREMQVLALVRSRPDGPPGPNLSRIEECSPAVVNELRRNFPEKYPAPRGTGVMSGCSSRGLGDLAALLTMGHDRPVIDATGLTDSFYFTIRSGFSPASTLIGRPTTTDPDLPAVSTALEEQLGLELQSRRAPVEVLVIDSVERPTPD